MMTLFLLLIIAALVLGIIGILANGLLYLLYIGILILVVDLAFFAFRSTRRRRPLR